MVTMNEAVAIAKNNSKLPTSIHLEVIKNYKQNNKIGILSYITLENEIISEVIKDGIKYYEVHFTKGKLSWQELSEDKTKIIAFHDGAISNGDLAKCLIKEDDGTYLYTGTCSIGLN